MADDASGKPRVLAVYAETPESRFLGTDPVSADDVRALDPAALRRYDYVLVSGGDGLIRRVFEHCLQHGHRPSVIVDPCGTSNILANFLRLRSPETVLADLRLGKRRVREQPVREIGGHIFLFSAGNFLDRIYMELAERLRVGPLRRHRLRYVLLLALCPIALMASFAYLSKARFFVFDVGFLRIALNVGARFEGPQRVQLDGDVVELPRGVLGIASRGTAEFLA